MPRKLKSETARRNGARSRGLVTEEGKCNASCIAVKHGIHSTPIVLQHEDPKAYNQLLTAYLDEWQPASPAEEALVLDMVKTRWRLQRIQEPASAVIEEEIDRYKDRLDRQRKTTTPASIYTGAQQLDACHTRLLEMFERWEACLHRSYHRALKVLRSLQTERLAAAEPGEQAKPKSGKTNPMARKGLRTSYLR